MQSNNMDLLGVIGHDTELAKAANTDGGEYAGPCPFCGGKDRFRVWPSPHDGPPRYWCRQCQKRGDAIQYLRDRHNLTYAEAVRRLGLAGPGWVARSPLPTIETIAPPPARWQSAAMGFVAQSIECLWSEQSKAARTWLYQRGLSGEGILAASLGYNPQDRYDTRAAWGLEPLWNEDGRPRQVWLPRGIVIPWLIDDAFWRLNIRRFSDARVLDGPKFIGPPGCAPGLYGADGLVPGRPAVLVEGEFDALTVSQDASHMAVAVATGSTTGARRIRWIARLALAPVVLVALDTDRAGEEASKYWCDVLPNAVRWRPFWGKDPNEFALQGGDIAGWVLTGLDQAHRKLH